MSTSDHLSRIESTGLIQLAQLEPELEYIFRHALIQDAAYGMLVKEQRRSVHSAVAHAIESLYPDRLTELAPQLAHHFDEAGELEKALFYSTTAAEQAGGRYANTEASIYYARAIDLAGQLQASRDILQKLYMGLGRVYQLSGKHEEALTTYLGLELVARERGDRALELQAHMEQATVYAMLTQQGNPEESIRQSEMALVIAREIGDEAAESKILWNISLAKWRSMAISEAIPYGEQSLEIARRLDQREQLAYTLHDLGRYYLLAGDHQRAITAQTEAEALWHELGNQPMLADNLSLKANLLYKIQDYSGAQAAAEEAFQISRGINNRWGQAMSLQSLSQLLEDQGELIKALEAAQDAIPASDQAGFMLGMFSNRGHVVELYDYLGQHERALEAQAELGRMTAQSSVEWIKGSLALLQAILALRAGDLDPARQLLEISKGWTRASLPTVPSYFDLRRAELAYKVGDHELVVTVVEPLDLQVSGLQLTGPDASQLARYQGLALMALGRLDEARAALAIAFSLVSHERIHYQRWELFAAMAEMDDLEGNPIAAQLHREEARTEIEYIAKRIGDPDMESTFRARPDVAALLASG